MKFAQNNHPTLSFGINEYTHLFGTWEYVLPYIHDKDITNIGFITIGDASSKKISLHISQDPKFESHVWIESALRG